MSVLCGAGVEFEVGGVTRRLGVTSPAVTFDGEAPACVRLLDGPVRHLNLMVAGVEGRLERVGSGSTWTPGPGCGGLFAWTSGRLRASPSDDALDVPGGTLVWFGRLPDALRFDVDRNEPPCNAWWVWAGATGAGG